MVVNLTDVFMNEAREQEWELSYEPDTYSSRLGNFPIKDKSPVQLKASNIGQSKALVECSVKLTLAFKCDRCLDEVDNTFDLSFSCEAVSPDYEGEDVDSDAPYMEGYHLNVDELINNEILLNWPVKILCREDCKGICPVCGSNLNKGECGCDAFVPDPRMAAIGDIFNANKEV